MKEKQKLETVSNYLDIIDILHIIWEQKKIVVITTILFVIISIAYLYKNRLLVSVATFSLSFSGIEKHEYPDGTKFEMGDIIAIDIIKKVKEELISNSLIKWPDEDIRENIKIEPIHLKSEFTNNEKNDVKHMPNKFRIKIIRSQSDSNASSDTEIKILYGIIKEYENKIKDRFINEMIIPVVLEDNNFAMMEYNEAWRVINSDIKNALGVIKNWLKETNYYFSSKEQFEILNILNRLNSIKEIELYDINALIKSNHIYNNIENIKNRYTYMIREKEIEMKKKQKESEISLSLLREVMKSKNSAKVANKSIEPLVIVEPSFFDKVKGQDYYDYLIKKSISDFVEYESKKIDMEYEKSYLSELSEIKNNAYNDAETKNQVEKLLDKVHQKTIETIMKANDIRKKIIEKQYSNTVKIIQFPTSFTLYPRKPNVLITISVILGFFTSVLLLLLLNSVRNHNARKKLTTTKKIRNNNKGSENIYDYR